jgi:hypothetical protein
MKTRLLIMNRNDARGTWGHISDDLWQNLLNHFAMKYANRIAFGGMADVETMKSIKVFQDWQPEYISNCSLRFTVEPESMKRNLAVFSFDNELSDKIASVQFSEWFVTSEYYPVDELYFFRNEELLFHTVHYESWITFYGLTEDQLKTLYAADKRIAANLYESNEMDIEIECK